MHLRHARLFCEIVARRSISAAAQACAISQPTASQAVSQIEQDLGVQLLDRSSRPLVVTPAGEMYAAGCRELLEQVAELEDRVRTVGNRLAGEVRIAAIYSVGLLEIRTLVDQFRDSHPDVEVLIDYCHPRHVYELLGDGQADLGLIAFPKATGDLTVDHWRTQSMVAVMHPGHRLAGQTAIEIAALQDVPFVALSNGLMTRRQVDRVLKSYGVSVREVNQFDNFDTLRRAVCDGAGVSIAPLAIFERDVASGLLAAVPIADAGPELVRPLGIVHRREPHLSAAARAFVDELLARERRAESEMRRKPRASLSGSGPEDAAESATPDKTPVDADAVGDHLGEPATEAAERAVMTQRE